DVCGSFNSSLIMSGLTACRNAGANVISMSLGGTGRSQAEQNAFTAAYNAGVLSIAAAGNDGMTVGSVDPYSYPASYDNVVSVAAIDSTEALATFSQENDHVELAAPGVGVLSTVPYIDTVTLTVGGVTFSGTHVEGAPRTMGVTGNLVDGGLCDSMGS